MSNETTSDNKLVNVGDALRVIRDSGVMMPDGTYRLNVDTFIQDQSSDRISLFLAKIVGLVDSMSGANKDADTFNVVTDGYVPLVGEFICMQEAGKISQEEIIAVTPVAGDEYTVKISVPLDYDYTSAGSCSIQDVDMNVDGSVTDQSYEVGPRDNYSWDITRLMVSMVLTTAGDDGKFGNLVSLPVGQYFRKEDSDNSQNLFSVKENSDFRIEGYDVNYVTRSGGGGSYGMAARITFGGQDKSGVVIRLNGITHDTFKTVIRDNLNSIVKYRIKVQGHIVE